MKASIQLILLLALFLPVSLLAQESNSQQNLSFDKAYFKESNYDMLEMFSSVLYDSSEYVTFIIVSKDYEMSGIGAKTKDDSLKVNVFIEKKNAKAAEIQESLILKPGKELFNYFAENLNPETIISFRKVAKEKVHLKRYELIY